MPDVIYAAEVDISHPLNVLNKLWTEKPYTYPNKYYSESHVQQLIKEAEERQRERCAEAYMDTVGMFEKMNYDVLYKKKAILNAGGE